MEMVVHRFPLLTALAFPDLVRLEAPEPELISEPMEPVDKDSETLGAGNARHFVSHPRAHACMAYPPA